MVRGLTQTRGLIRGERRDIQNPAAVATSSCPQGARCVGQLRQP